MKIASCSSYFYGISFEYNSMIVGTGSPRQWARERLNLPKLGSIYYAVIFLFVNLYFYKLYHNKAHYFQGCFYLCIMSMRSMLIESVKGQCPAIIPLQQLINGLRNSQSPCGRCAKLCVSYCTTLLF